MGWSATRRGKKIVAEFREEMAVDQARLLAPTLYRFAVGLRFYIASTLANAVEVRALAHKLIEEGHIWTYDWTGHGAVFKDTNTREENVEIMRETGRKEIEGVTSADVVIVLLPGGKGTHVELGVALGRFIPVIMTTLDGAHPYYTDGKVLHKEAKNYPCAFWFHKDVIHQEINEVVDRVRDLTVRLRALAVKKPGCDWPLVAERAQATTSLLATLGVPDGTSWTDYSESSRF